METNIRNKCKAYTSLEQSRKLAEILPMGSADMWYCPYSNNEDWYKRPYIGKAELSANRLPCWSLAALLDVLPILDNRSPIISKTFDGKYRVVYHSTAYEKAILTSDYDNPVDACVEMITKLNELKML